MVIFLGYDVEISGLGLPKNGDTSKGYCTQIAKFTKQSLNLKNPNLISQENFEIDETVEYCSWVYPFSDPCHNIKTRIIDEIKYGYKLLSQNYFYIFRQINYLYKAF